MAYMSARPQSKGKIKTITTYVEMAAAPPQSGTLAPPLEGLEILRRPKPGISFYRFLYETVGSNYTWTARTLMTDEELAKMIHDPAVEVHVLHVNGKPAGFVELDCRKAPEVEISMFGLFPEYIGRKLGPYFLDWAIGYAWKEKRPQRLWLHTCTLDHPKALSMYRKAGFVEYAKEEELADLI